MKRVVWASVLALVSTFVAAQDITLKKLYDPIEDFEQQHQNVGKMVDRNVSSTENQRVNAIARSTLEAYLKRSGQWKTCQDQTLNGFHGLRIDRVHQGSFTKPGRQQRAYRFSFCEPVEYFTCVPGFHGVLVLEEQRLVAMHVTRACMRESFAVSDINQNGLSEFMLTWIGKQDSERISIRLLEFPNGAIRNLGDLEVGVQVGWDDVFPSEFCTGNVQVPSTNKTFLSDIIFVRKSPSPQFFSERYEVNCNYRQIGVKARKVRDLTPIKPVMRSSGFTRIF